MTDIISANPQSAPAPQRNNADAKAGEIGKPGFAGQKTDLGGETVGNVSCDDPFMVARDIDVYYGDNHAIQHVSLEIAKKEVIALIGPSGCGKSTFLRCLNRMNDTIETARVTGTITLDGQDIYLSLIHI